MSCEHIERTSAYVLQVLPADEMAAAAAHVADCAECTREVERLQAVVGRFHAWPTDVLRPTSDLQARLARRIADEAGSEPVAPPPRAWTEPAWEQVAPGISCKLLAADEERQLISMLVHLEPGAAYPPHTHAGIEELFLLDGELWINGEKLYPGDYNYGAPGAFDESVWTETGCSCVLVTSMKDTLS